ncbi:hypothetical protein AB837_00617 [bacterium AB1]|nr:hypothetical protein AB837_00617 [bacterium AB1]
MPDFYRIVKSSDYEKICWLLEDYCNTFSFKSDMSSVLALDFNNTQLSLEEDSEYNLAINPELLASIENTEIKDCIYHFVKYSGSNVANIQFLTFLKSVYCKSSSSLKDHSQFRVYQNTIHRQLSEFRKKSVTMREGDMDMISNFMIDLFSIMLYVKDPKFVLEAQNCEFVKKYKPNGQEYIETIALEATGHPYIINAIAKSAKLQKEKITSSKCLAIYSIAYHIMNVNDRIKRDKSAIFADYKTWFSKNYLQFTKINGLSLYKSYRSLAVNAQFIRYFKNETFDKLMDLFNYFMNNSSEEDYVKTIFHKISCFNEQDFQITETKDK